jgi:hypothetical protein
MNQALPSLPNASNTSKDAEHLKLLAIFHFIFAAMALLGIGFLCVHYMIMSTVMNNPKFWQGKETNGFSHQEFFAAIRWFYVFMGAFFIFGGLINLISGFFLMAKKNRMFSLVVAGVDCIQIPFGTALGAFTIIVLSRDSVRTLYDFPAS